MNDDAKMVLHISSDHPLKYLLMMNLDSTDPFPDARHKQVLSMTVDIVDFVACSSWKIS